MIIDFRRKPTSIPDLYIGDEKVERVSQYKYLGSIIDNKLKFNQNIESINKKCQSRIYCLQKLRSLKVNTNILTTFYKSFIESVVTYGFLCWFGGLNVRNRMMLNRVVNVCGKVVGERQQSLNELYEHRVVRKAEAILNDASHVLASQYCLLPSNRRFSMPNTTTQRARKSFVPQSIVLFCSFCL